MDFLKRSEQIFRRVWDDSLDGMRLTDEKGTVLLANPAYCRMVRKTTEELVGRPFSVIYAVEHPEAILEKHQKRFAERNVAPVFERELLLWNGEKIWFELSNSFLEMDGEAVLLSIFRDVSERKEAEEKLREVAASLAVSNRELQDFAYVASHDLQEPLRKVVVFGDRLKTGYAVALGEDGRDYIERMQRAALRMQKLIDDLLTFSRVTTKSQPFVPVNLDRVVQEVISDLEARIEQLGGRVEAGPLPMIEAEPLHMRQMFQNLIGNALKFHKPDEKPVVKISGRIIENPDWTGLRQTARELLELSVSDNGIGFDEKYLDRIFQVFQRLHGRDVYEGTGMGLAITRKIAEHHHGTITARSKPGEGTTFILTFPTKQSKPTPTTS